MAPPDHPPIPKPAIGLLLVNLGTPAAPTAAAVRRYLGEFLSDRRVIEIPKALWLPILHGIVLRTRPGKSAAAYAKIWGEDGSPLAAISRRQAEALQQRLGSNVLVEQAMRYGEPSLGQALGRLRAGGCERILAAPLYPQYCAATTASASDALFAWAAKQRWQPALRTLPPYHDNPHYIAALALSIRRQLGALQFEPERLLLSFHGMPERTLLLGDPYHCHCRKTARLLGQALGREVDTSFQSRFGRARWLQPSTESVLAGYPGKGVRRIAVAAPGFSADCLETIEELGIRGREIFLKGGGERFERLDCLNDSSESIDMIEAIVRRELAGWLPSK